MTQGSVGDAAGQGAGFVLSLSSDDEIPGRQVNRRVLLVDEVDATLGEDLEEPVLKAFLFVEHCAPVNNRDAVSMPSRFAVGEDDRSIRVFRRLAQLRFFWYRRDADEKNISLPRHETGHALSFLS